MLAMRMGPSPVPELKEVAPTSVMGPAKLSEALFVITGPLMETVPPLWLKAPSAEMVPAAVLVKRPPLLTVMVPVCVVVQLAPLVKLCPEREMPAAADVIRSPLKMVVPVREADVWVNDAAVTF